MRAMILAAGFGTRLGSLSDERPKPLLPVCDVALIRYNLALLAGHGFREVAINLHHLGGLIADELADWVGPPAITWSYEEVILGPGGGLKKMEGWLTDGGREPFLVLNGKLIVDVDLGALVAMHQSKGACATMVVREVPDAERWGAIDSDEEGGVVRIVGESRPGGGEIVHRSMFTGVHVIGPELIARLPEGESHVIGEGYQPLLRAGAPIAAMLYGGYFQEHSTPARYLDGNFAVLRGEARLRHPPGPLTGVDPLATVAASAKLVGPLRIGPGARVEEGASVGPDVVVGRGATVAAGARIERAVAWPGARVEGLVQGAIVTPRGVFSVEGTK
jgi:NDP-sugar pyrophosphorylase family protein